MLSKFFMLTGFVKFGPVLTKAMRHLLSYRTPQHPITPTKDAAIPAPISIKAEKTYSLELRRTTIRTLVGSAMAQIPTVAAPTPLIYNNTKKNLLFCVRV